MRMISDDAASPLAKSSQGGISRCFSTIAFPKIALTKFKSVAQRRRAPRGVRGRPTAALLLSLSVRLVLRGGGRRSRPVLARRRHARLHRRGHSETLRGRRATIRTPQSQRLKSVAKEREKNRKKDSLIQRRARARARKMARRENPPPRE